MIIRCSSRGALGIILAITALWLTPPVTVNASAVAWWKMEPESGEYATDTIGGFQDAVSGTRMYNVNGVSNQSLIFDGLTTYITRASANAPTLSGSFSLETWIALQEYPWNWTAIIDRQNNHSSGYLLNIDDVGHLGFSVAAGGNWWSCTTAGADRDYNSILHTNGWTTGSLHTMYRKDGKLQLTVGGNNPVDTASTANVTAGKWSHLTFVYSSSTATKTVKFYIDGALKGTTALSTANSAVLGALQLGGWDGGGRNFKCYMDDFRLFGRALTAAEVTNLNSGSGPTDAIAWWKFNETSGTTAADSTGNGHTGTLHGCSWLAGKYGNCVNMNGVDDYVSVPAIGTYADFSISVWVNFNVGSTALPLQQWQHVIATYDTSAGLSLYLNGAQIAQGTGSGTPTAPTGVDLQIGYGRDKQYPTNTERGPSMIGSPMLLSGLLDEAKIYNTALSQAEVTAAYNAATPPVPQPLSYWQMPTGTPVTGEFGASYQKLKYSDQWDTAFRSGEAADVLVKFDQMPVNYVFWKGWNYGLCLTTENGLLYCDQSVEWSDGYGCVEHMSDKQDRYAHIDIVENNDARVVVKWRYAPCNIMYGLFNVDGTTGWANWVDEYFYIYPDGVMMREQNTWTTASVELGYVGGWGGWPSNQETIFFNQPGKRQLDTVNQDAVTLANDAGQSQTYTWWSGMPNQPATPTIQMVNFKSTYRPYLIRRPGAMIASFGPSGYIDPGFPYWDHWPVCQLPNDGRQAPRTDRPAHTSLSWFTEPPISHSGIYYTWIYMYGLTTQTAAQLATQSKAWNTPASLTIASGGYTSQGFSTTQKAWQLTSNLFGSPSNLTFTINGSASSPILNPAIVIQGWGDILPAISINGVNTPRNTDCRMGINYGLSNNSLVIWLKRQSTSPLTVTLTTGIEPPPVVSIGAARKMDDGDLITLSAKSVTYAPRDVSLARSTNYFYVEETNRSTGIKVANGYAGQDDLNVDVLATLTGTLQTDSTTLERCLVLSAPPSPGAGGPVNPVGMNTRSVLNDANAVGEYVRIAGKVNSVADDKLSFVMSDGYGADVTVITETGQQITNISSGNMVAVNGIVSKADATTRQILLRKVTRLVPPEPSIPALAYYKFDEGTGLTAADSSDHHYDATLRSTGCAWVAGVFNSAIDFNNGYVTCPNLGTGYGKFTMACWINVRTLAQGANWDAWSIASSDGWSSGCVAFLLLGANNSSNLHPRKLQLSVDGALGNDLIWSNYTFTDDKLNTWVHVAIVYDNTAGAKFYINGVLDSSAAFATSQTATLASVKIGSWGTSRYFSGKIDDFRLFDRVLSAAEIAQIYNGQAN